MFPVEIRLCRLQQPTARQVARGGHWFVFARIGFDAVDARQHADDIAIENRCGLIEGDAANRTRRVATNAGQGEDGGEVRREKPSPMDGALGDNLLGGFLHVADAGV